MADWRSFRFSNPTSAVQQNYNWLASNVGPEYAVAYMTNPTAVGSAEQNIWKEQIGPVGNPLINQFNEPVPGGNELTASLGFPSGWYPPKWGIEGGQFITDTGSFKLPAASTPSGSMAPPPTTTPPPTGAPPPTGLPSAPAGSYGGNTTAPSDFYGTLPRATRTFEGFPEGTGNQALLPGYGMSQQIDQTGIAGLERNQLIGGGSWAGTVWNPVNGQATYTQNPLTFPETDYYDTNGNPKPLTAGNMSIRPAAPWYTTNYLQTYGGVPAPFNNIHQQIGASMAGLPAAYPGFKWANPEMMKLGQPGATGVPPGGWTQMLGFTPGQATNYGFVGGRPNPYGIGGMPLAVNPTIG